jgi:hypothetical protein
MAQRRNGVSQSLWIPFDIMIALVLLGDLRSWEVGIKKAHAMAQGRNVYLSRFWHKRFFVAILWSISLI